MDDLDQSFNMSMSLSAIMSKKRIHNQSSQLTNSANSTIVKNQMPIQLQNLKQFTYDD